MGISKSQNLRNYKKKKVGVTFAFILAFTNGCLLNNNETIDKNTNELFFQGESWEKGVWRKDVPLCTIM